MAILTPEKFWERLDTTGSTGCWEWPGTRINDGYGQVQMRGKRWYAHRLAYTLTFGQIPDGLMVCHHCDNPPCCRPDHLFLGTCLDNKADQRAKGRTLTGDRNPARWPGTRLLRGEEWYRHCMTPNRAQGERHPNASVTEEQVREIRRLYEAGSVTISALARQYGVTRHAVLQIVRRQTWKHVA